MSVKQTFIMEMVYKLRGQELNPKYVTIPLSRYKQKQRRKPWHADHVSIYRGITMLSIAE